MNWIVYLSGAAIALAAADVFVKSAAGKLPDSLGMLLYGTVPFLTGLVWYAADRFRGSTHAVEPRAIGFAIGVGIMFTAVTFAMYAAFRHGAPLSLASPLVRLGGLLVASIVGFLVWREVITVRYCIGLALAGSGVYLIMTR